MNLSNVLNAKTALTRLMEVKFTGYKVLRDLVKLRKKVDNEYDFYATQEKKIVMQYAELENEQPVFLSDGRIKLKDYESKVAFEEEIKKLKETEVDGIELVVIHESDFKTNADLPTAEDMLVLEGFVSFED